MSFYSEKYGLRAKAERAEAVAKARKIALHSTRLKTLLDKTAAEKMLAALSRLEQMLETRQTPAHRLISRYEKSGSILAALGC